MKRRIPRKIIGGMYIPQFTTHRTKRKVLIGAEEFIWAMAAIFTARQI